MSTLDQDILVKFHQIYWLLHKRHRRHGEASPVSDPAKGQGRILALLQMRDGISAKDLSYLLNIRISSLNETLFKLEKNGYIVREPSEKDRRVMLVKLTDKGREVQQDEAEPLDILSCLSEQEQLELSNYLDKLIASLEDMANSEGKDAFAQMAAIHERMGDEFFERFGHRMGGFPDRHRGGFGRSFNNRH
jgi:DNA-binding MarR family transcriptional regulator